MFIVFLYNAVGDIWKEKSLNRHEKQIMILSILNEYKVRNMFKRLKILKLPISNKLKIVTLMYKYHILWILNLEKR